MISFQETTMTMKHLLGILILTAVFHLNSCGWDDRWAAADDGGDMADIAEDTMGTMENWDAEETMEDWGNNDVGYEPPGDPYGGSYGNHHDNYGMSHGGGPMGAPWDMHDYRIPPDMGMGETPSLLQTILGGVDASYKVG